MEWKVRPWLMLGAIVLTATLTWWLVPSPFARGVVVGALAGPGFLIAGLTLLSRKLRKRHPSRLRAPPLPVEKWDYDMVVSDLSGAEIQFIELAGRVVVLNFWATSCAPCVAEMPSLARLEAATADAGVRLACVTREPASKVADFLKKRDLSVPIYLLEGDPPECFATMSIPATFVIDKKGSVVLRHRGAAAWDDPSIVDFVRGLAAVPGS